MGQYLSRLNQMLRSKKSTNDMTSHNTSASGQSSHPIKSALESEKHCKHLEWDSEYTLKGLMQFFYFLSFQSCFSNIFQQGKCRFVTSIMIHIPNRAHEHFMFYKEPYLLPLLEVIASGLCILNVKNPKKLNNFHWHILKYMYTYVNNISNMWV